MGDRARGLLGATATPGSTSRTTRRAAAPTAGVRTGCSASATARAGSASRLALWNGRDPILKERLFGLTGPEGNHGEDVKEAYFYLDSTPTHSYLKALYKYPAGGVPLRAPGRGEPRAGQGATRSSSWPTPASSMRAATSTSSPSTPRRRPTTSPSASPSPTAAPRPRTLHLLPTLWFRNTWSWGREGRGLLAAPRAAPEWSGGQRRGDARRAGRLRLVRGAGRASRPALLFTENETNVERLFGAPNAQPVRQGRLPPGTSIERRAGRGQSRRARGPRPPSHYVLDVPAGGERVCDSGCRRSAEASRPTPSAPTSSAVFAAADPRGGRVLRERTARRPRPRTSSRSLRQGYAGLLWSKQFYHYVVRALAGGRSRAAAAAGERRSRAATPTGRTCTTATSSPCRTSGSTPGSRPGTSHST